MYQISSNNETIEFHVGDDSAGSGDLSCRCTRANNENEILEPIRVKKSKVPIEFDFRLMNPDYKFVGFMSPQDRKHDCFEVMGIKDDANKRSLMTVRDHFKRNFCDDLFDYELVYKKRDDAIGGNLYRYDPQIRNED